MRERDDGLRALLSEIASTIARLTAENAALRERVEKMQAVVDAACAFVDVPDDDDIEGIEAAIQVHQTVAQYLNPSAPEASE